MARRICWISSLLRDEEVCPEEENCPEEEICPEEICPEEICPEDRNCPEDEICPEEICPEEELWLDEEEDTARIDSALFICWSQTS